MWSAQVETLWFSKQIPQESIYRDNTLVSGSIQAAETATWRARESVQMSSRCVETFSGKQSAETSKRIIVTGTA